MALNSMTRWVSEWREGEEGVCFERNTDEADL